MEIRMKRIRYEAKIKAAIVTAVQEARKGGKSWAQALDAAQQAGYKGTVASLTQFVGPSGPTKKKSAAKKTKASVKPALAAPAVSRPAVKAAPVQLDIATLVQKTVTDAVVNALEALVANIKDGK
jgi:hypothetical protein